MYWYVMPDHPDILQDGVGRGWSYFLNVICVYQNMHFLQYSWGVETHTSCGMRF